MRWNRDLHSWSSKDSSVHQKSEFAAIHKLAWERNNWAANMLIRNRGRNCIHTPLTRMCVYIIYMTDQCICRQSVVLPSLLRVRTSVGAGIVVFNTIQVASMVRISPFFYTSVGCRYLTVLLFWIPFGFIYYARILVLRQNHPNINMV